MVLDTVLDAVVDVVLTITAVTDDGIVGVVAMLFFLSGYYYYTTILVCAHLDCLLFCVVNAIVDEKNSFEHMFMIRGTVLHQKVNNRGLRFLTFTKKLFSSILPRVLHRWVLGCFIHFLFQKHLKSHFLMRFQHDWYFHKVISMTQMLFHIKR